MGGALTLLDACVLLASLVGVMAVGLWAGRKEDTTADYFLAGREARWWGVAGSIFGTNVSENHIVGMMGIGFSVGFAQSHFELGAIAGLMVLCYGFLPVYRALRLYTLSDYLRQRYDERAAALYTVLMLVFIVLVMMVQGFYIGSRSLNVLLAPPADEAMSVSSPSGSGGLAAGREIVRPRIDFGAYAAGVLLLATIAATYTVVGGLKAVIWTDVIQSVLLLVAGIIVAMLVFSQPEIGGWSGMRALDRQAAAGAEIGQPPAGADAAGRKLRLYLPSDHGELPWTGVLSGLLVLHFFYWGTNQFIVQRALAARSDNDARQGIVVAGFLKLLIPFFSIGGGIAAYYLFQRRLPGVRIDSDAAFTEVVKLVVPRGLGIMGIIAAGLFGAILSSIDSMMNSAATLVTFDVYHRYVNPDASERRLICVGRVSILAFVAISACVAIFLLDANSTDHFFLVIVDQQSYLVPGLVVAFFLGILWPRATATSAFVTILLGPIFSALLHTGYGLAAQGHLLEGGALAGDAPTLLRWFGPQLNTFHRVAATVLFCLVLQVLVSLVTRPHPQKGRLTWAGLGGHDRQATWRIACRLAFSIMLLLVLAMAVVSGKVAPSTAAWLAGAWTFLVGLRFAWESAELKGSRPDVSRESKVGRLLGEDRFWAGLLCGLAVFILFYFY
jgi:SSS family solute:Na+ symporter